MFGYGCPEPIDVSLAFASYTDKILMVKGNWGEVYIPEFEYNFLGDLTTGFGYQIKLSETIVDFSLCDWYISDIPEDNIVTLQEDFENLQVLNNEILSSNSQHCFEEGYCAYSLELFDCYHPEFGFDCNGDSLELFIGQEAYGGIIFYIDETGERGLVAAMEDVLQGSFELEIQFEWGCYGVDVSGADEIAIGEGYQNTLDIVNSECETETGGITAAQAAIDYEVNGYDDWFLPSRDELLEMYYTIGLGGLQGNLGVFSNAGYWSSSEISDLESWFVSSDGGMSNYSKSWGGASHYVRPIRAFGYTLGCMDSLACNYNSDANMANGNCEYPELDYDCEGNFNAQIGDEIEGGLVFYLDETGQRGLVAAMEDIGQHEWGCVNTYISGADGTIIGSGYKNTLDINLDCTEISIAASEALAYESGVYEDWYLPSRDELIEMYNTIGNGGPETNIANFQNDNYWSSSESTIHAPWLVHFNNGLINGTNSKASNYWVRPIRAFGNWVMGCMDEESCNYNPEANMADGSCVYAELGYDCDGVFTAEIGDVIEGGYLFYLDESGEHGLVAAMEDITEGSSMGAWGTPEGFEWGCMGLAVSGADGTSIGTGYQNTLDIIAQNCQTENGGISAAQATLNYSSEGFTDWYLPSKEELEEMYDTIGGGSSQGNIGGFETSDYSYYWSSSEETNSLAWFVNFYNYIPDGTDKFQSLRVRAVRAF